MTMELSIVIKVTIFLACALLAVRVAAAARASLRHLVLAATFCVIAVLPLATVVIPPVPVDVPLPLAESMVMSSASVPSIVETPLPPTGGATPQATESNEFSVSPAVILRSVWAIGTLLFLIPVVTAFARLRRLREHGLPWLDMRPPARDLATQAGVARPVDVLLHEHVPVPMTAGWLRPTILLPIDAREWPESERRNALVHELEHVRRADWVFHTVGRVACGLYWFHPLAWIGWRKMALEAERACDDAVLRETDGPAYATQLVNLASRHTSGIAQPALAMANRSDLAARVSSILKAQQARGRASRWAGVTITLGAIFIAVTVSSLRAVVPVRSVSGAPRQAPAPAVASPAKFEVASLKRVQNIIPGVMIIPRVTPGRLVISNAPLRNLIARAYDIQAARVVEAPGFTLKDLGWEQFDLEATTGLPALTAREALQRLQPALQAMLSERFKLRIHRETREVMGYALVPAIRGHKLKTISEDLDPTLIHANVSVALERSEATFSKAPLSALVNQLAVNLQAPVVDETQLDGFYDFTLRWKTPDGEFLSWFDAVESQLGLRLDKRLVKADFLVIEHAEPPTEN